MMMMMMMRSSARSLQQMLSTKKKKRRRRGSVPHDLREASPGLRTYSGPLRLNATRSLYVTVRVVIVRLVGRPRHEPVRMIDRLRNKVTQFSSFFSI